MPKGVEHNTILRYGNGDPVVPDTLMPKGVEHLQAPLNSSMFVAVPDTLMPKGVEHEGWRAGWKRRRSSQYVDAERR